VLTLFCQLPHTALISPLYIICALLANSKKFNRNTHTHTHTHDKRGREGEREFLGIEREGVIIADRERSEHT
jgi:hypothetical protein